MALRRLDERADVPDEQPVAVAGERRHEVERRRALPLLAPEVVGERLVQRRREVRRRAHEFVVRVQGVGDEALAAAHPVVDAQQPDEVGTVAVEPERVPADLVAPRRRIVGCLALVGDVAEQVALGVLRPRLAEVPADAPVDPRGVLRPETVDVERADAPEAAAVHELLGEVVQQRCERGQREVGRP